MKFFDGRKNLDKTFENLLTMDEFLSLLKNQYSRKTVYGWVYKGMPNKKIGNRLWFPVNECLVWLEGN